MTTCAREDSRTRARACARLTASSVTRGRHSFVRLRCRPHDALLGWRGRFTHREASWPLSEELHLTPSIAAALTRLGWRADDRLLREAAPTAARGHNLVLVLPPSPAAATPALAGMLSRLGEGRGGLLLAPSAQLDEWGRLVHQVAGDSGLRVQVAHGTARAARRLLGDDVDLVITTPEIATALQRRAALHADALAAVFLAWPEAWEEAESLSPLMQDFDKDAQRIVVTAAADGAEALVERYARRALTLGSGALEGEVGGAVRTVSVPWGRRASALPDLVELLDPTSLVVWTADRALHETIAAVLGLREPEGRVVIGEAPPAQVVIAFDLPSRKQLRQLASAGEVVLLMPPGTEAYVERLATPRRPLRLPGALDAATTAAAARRAAIVRTLETEHAGAAPCSRWRRCSSGTIPPRWRRRCTSSGPAPPAPPPPRRCPTYPPPPSVRGDQARRTAPRRTTWSPC